MKKILFGLVAVVVVAGGVAGMSAYEAHVINVTAHVENALTTHSDPLHFGTVFPQEYLERNFTISLSNSFQTSQREDLVRYKIVQKPKCECTEDPANTELCPHGEYAAVDYATHLCPENYVMMEDLCEFLSKLPTAETPDGESGVPSYYEEGNPDSCVPRGENDPRLHVALGVLGAGDLSDEWAVDLKVPPVEGYIGQDWPETCADWTVPTDGADYGCDLWVEVTCIGSPEDCPVPVLQQPQ